MPAWANKLTGKRAFKAKAAAIMAHNSLKNKMSFAGKSAADSAGAGIGGPPVPLNASTSSAPLPSPSSSSGLSSLQFARAPKKEEVPPPLGWACAGTLRILKLQANRFTGPLPEAMSEFSALEVLRLDGNKFTGNLPLACFACAAAASSSAVSSSHGVSSTSSNSSKSITAIGSRNTGLAPWHRLIELRLGGGNSFDGPLPPHLGDACPSLEVRMDLLH